MPTIILRPKITLQVNGKSYPVNAASVEASIGTVLRFTFTVVSNSNDSSQSLTIQDVRDLVAELQNSVYKDPKESAIKLDVTGDKIKSFSIEGIATAVNSYATTDGGVRCEVSGASADILMEMANFSHYLTYVDGRTAIEDCIKGGVSPRTNKVYVDLMDTNMRDSTSESIARRVTAMLSTAQSKWRKVSQVVLDKLPQTTVQAINSIDSSNKEHMSQIKTFLNESDKTSKIFNGEAQINKETARLVAGGIHTCLFERGDSFLSSLFSICDMFRLWYVPRISDKKGAGILMNQKYGDEKNDGTTNIYINQLDYNLGGIWANKPPCKAVAVQAVMGNDALSQVASLNRTPASRILGAVYPKEPKRKYGITYLVNADSWLSLPEYSTEEQQNISNTTKQALQNGKIDKGKRVPDTVSKTNEKIKETSKKIVDKVTEVLEYLAKKTYYRTLLAPSTASFTGPFTGMDFEVGDMITVNTVKASELATGIVSSISINLDAESGTSFMVNLSNVKVKGVEVE